MFYAAHAGRSNFALPCILILFFQGLLASAQVTRLSFRPVDAVYSRSLDRLIFISADPAQLHIYNVPAESEQTVALSGTPMKIALGPDGRHAAVAFSNAVAYVDLQAGSVERTVSIARFGIANLMVGFGYIYVMPTDSWNPISINTSTGEVTTTQIPEFTYAAVFNSTLNAIYATNGSYSGGLKRYSAAGVLGSNSTSQPTTYSGSQAVCGPLSLSEDNSTIYTGCGPVYRASSDTGRDMRYLGALPGVPAMKSLAESETLKEVAAIPGTAGISIADNDTVVRLFDSVFFNPVGQLTPTPFTVASVSYPAHGRWVFFDALSSHLVLVTQADQRAALTQDFAVENVDLSNPNSCNALFGATSVSVQDTGAYATTPILSGQDCLFTATSNAPWITLTSGSFGSGNATLTYLVRPNLDPTPRSGTISMGSQIFTVNQQGRTGGSALTPLSFRPVAADYDKALDRVVMAAASPNELHIYDPVSQDDAIVPLNSIPLSVSVRPDGLFAAVGHRGSISIIDLTARSVTQTIAVDADNSAILLAANGYAYSFPAGSSPGMISVQLSTSTLTKLSGPYYGTSPRLHPSGDYIYLGSSSSASKLDIRNGPAALLPTVDSIFGNIWLSESGDRLLNSNAYAYLTSSTAALDLTPNGRLSGSNTVAWATNSARLNQTAILSDLSILANTELQLYSDTGLQLQKQLELPGFSNAGRTYRSQGRYIFWNSDSSKLFAITQAEYSSGLLSDFSIYTVDSLDSLPTCSWAVFPAQLTIPASGFQNWSFNVSSNCGWSPSFVDSGVTWVYLNGGSSYPVGNGTIYITAFENTGATRSTSIKIGDQIASITQTGASCTYSLSSDTGIFPPEGGRGVVSLITGPTCPWSVQSASAWASISSSRSGVGPVTIIYSVDPNTTSSASRSGFLIVAGQTFTLNQSAPAFCVPSNFMPIPPCRLVDTRLFAGSSSFAGPSLLANSTRTFYMAFNGCNIPTSATAYSLNITVVPQGPLDYLTAWPAGQVQPFVSTLNSRDGRVKANAAIIPAGPNKGLNFYSTDKTDLVVDITGYFVDASSESGLAFYPLAPCRIADTRELNGLLSGPVLIGGATRQLPILQSECGLNASAQAYSLNFTAIPDEDRLQYLTTWPSGGSKPFVSTLNAWTGQVTANAAILQAGSAGDISVFATENSHLAIDTNGYFALPNVGGLHLYTVPPCRALDTRTTGDGRPFKGVIPVQMSGLCNIPSSASAVIMNATVVPSQRLDYLTLWPYGAQQPLVSTLNAFDGTVSSNMAITPLSQGMLNAFATDNTHLILDVTGYFAP